MSGIEPKQKRYRVTFVIQGNRMLAAKVMPAFVHELRKVTRLELSMMRAAGWRADSPRPGEPTKAEIMAATFMERGTPLEDQHTKADGEFHLGSWMGARVYLDVESIAQVVKERMPSFGREPQGDE